MSRGYTIGTDVVHPLEVTVVRLNQTGSTVDEGCFQSNRPHGDDADGRDAEIHLHVIHAVERLDARGDGGRELAVWYYPDAAFVDRSRREGKLVREEISARRLA